jgi:hypothetical protein
MYHYFQTYNFYDDDLIFNKEEQCLICWEFSDDINEINNLQSLIIFDSTCNCNSYFHNKCLYDWVKRTQSCPICHKFLTIKNNKVYRFLNKSFIQNSLNKVSFVRFFTIIIYLSKVVSYYFLLQLFILLCKVYFHTHYEYLEHIKETVDKEYITSENEVYYYNHSYL